jgi:tripeptide aminopeptidase
MKNEEYTGLVQDRFLRYVRFGTASVPNKDKTPSTPGQWEFAKALVEELGNLGVADVDLTEYCYVIARIPATPGRESRPCVGFMAHLDTAPDVPGEPVKPQLRNPYNGERIGLANSMVLDPAADPDLAAQKGKAIIHADGATLLGADDKAGIAAIMGAVEHLMKHPEIAHGPIELFFTPDEEVGSGLFGFPQDQVKATACYTVDGGALGGIHSECFNAYEAKIDFIGRAAHLGAARGRMLNPTVMAASFVLMLPRVESPEATDGYYGYYCPMNISSNAETASLRVYLRDFGRAGAARRITALETFARAVEAQFPGSSVSVSVTPQYTNMKEKLDAKPEVMKMLREALANAEIPCRDTPIRGGTDGARLTQLGIPTPNIFTGARNAHSRFEWVSVPEMAAACQVVVELAKLWGNK